ncbi:helix-turn-helix transcriptional regulator [Citrobacter braakii]|uniref:helix-turn-helix transcriptional regulator n=1 Tax=Citrobacter braakii TaxID=57706 RepID=UPI004039B765
MPDDKNELMLTDEVMAKLRYSPSSNSAFYAFLRDKRQGFPMPFKMGNRNFWYRSEVDDWMEKKSQVRGLGAFSDERVARMHGNRRKQQ